MWYPSPMKQVIVLRKDLNMRKGKMVAQGAHASLGAILKNCQLADSSDLREWLEGRFTKICVSVDSEEELLEIYQKARTAKLLCCLITDSGLTEFNNVPTKTAVGIGPGPEDKIDEITGDLQLL